MIFNEEQLKQIEILASQGLSMKQIADYLGLSYFNFLSILKKYPEIIRIYRKERIKTEIKVADILFHKAMGTFKPNNY